MSARDFALGLLWGALAVVASPLPARLFRRPTADIGGLAFALATYIGVRGAVGAADAPLSIALALTVLALGGAAVDRVELQLSPALPRAGFAAALALAPGALALAIAVPIRHPLWVPCTVFVSAVIVGGLLHDFDRTHGAKAAPFLLLLIACLGAYLSVPDTRMAVVLCGVAVPLALLSFPQPLAALGPAGSAAVAGAFCWVVIASGTENPATVVAGLAALGLLLGEPLARRFRRFLRNSPPVIRPPARRLRTHVRASRPDRWFLVVPAAAVCQIALVVYVARISAMEGTAGMAFVSLSAPFVIVALVATEVVPSEPVRSRSHSSRVPTIRRPAQRGTGAT